MRGRVGSWARSFSNPRYVTMQRRVGSIVVFCRIVVFWRIRKVSTSRPRAHAPRRFFSVFRAVLARSIEIIP